VQAVVRELHGEKIDIISWTEDPQRFIAEALSPAEIDRVGISEAEGSAVVIVRDDQLSLAIGKKGQNVRLASRLTGWNLDILSESEYREDAFEGKDEELEAALLGHARAKAQGLTDAEALFSAFPDGPPEEGAEAPQAGAAPAEGAPEGTETTAAEGEPAATEATEAPEGAAPEAAETPEPEPAEAEPAESEEEKAQGATPEAEAGAVPQAGAAPEGEAPAGEGEKAEGEPAPDEQPPEEQPKDKPAGTIDAAKASQ